MIAYRLWLCTSIALVALSICSIHTAVWAQSTDAELDALLGNTLPTSGANRWYTANDTNSVRVIGLNGSAVTIEAPIAKKNNQNITTYFIAWWTVSYHAITTDSNADITKIKDSVLNTSDIQYSITGSSSNSGMVLRIVITISDTAADQYITIIPQDGNNQGNGIEDYKFNVGANTWQTAVLADSNNANLNQAITNISCTRAGNNDEVTLRRDRNTALNATKVEISYKTDASQWSMQVKGTPAIADKSFTFETDNREETLLKLKPLASNNAPVGNEVMYTCKSDGNPDTHDAGDTNDNNTDTPTSITTVPHTGPKETFAIVLIATLVLYGIYRKLKA